MDEEIITGIVEEVEERLEGVIPDLRQFAIDHSLARLTEDFGYKYHHQEEVAEARRRLEESLIAGQPPVKRSKPEN